MSDTFIVNGASFKDILFACHLLCAGACGCISLDMLCNKHILAILAQESGLLYIKFCKMFTTVAVECNGVRCDEFVCCYKMKQNEVGSAAWTTNTKSSCDGNFFLDKFYFLKEQ